MKKRILVGLLELVIELTLAGIVLSLLNIIAVGDYLLEFGLFGLAIIIGGLKLVERKFFPNPSNKSRYFQILIPNIILSIIILAYWYFVDLPSGGWLAGISIILLVIPITIFCANVIFELFRLVVLKVKKSFWKKEQ